MLAAVSGMVAVPAVLLPWGGVIEHSRALGLVIGALTLFVALIVMAFAVRYLRADPRGAAFGVTLGLLVGCVLTCVATGSLFVLAAAWVASGRLLARLIGHDTTWPEARAAARRARHAFAVGDSALVAGLLVLGLSTGSAAITPVLAQSATLAGPTGAAAALLLMIAAAARCALPPFAGWLASSMTAPTPVSALMHAGLVNAGGFLLIRFAPLFEAAPLARLAAIAAGLGAALYGLGVMCVRPDIKRSLAGSTVSQMGFMIMSCGLGAYGAALWHIVAHGLFKAWLFLGSGSAIGIGKTPAAPGLTHSIKGCAILVLAGALVLTWAGHMDGALVPLLLALATAMVTLNAGLGTQMPMRSRLAATAILIVLAATQAIGVWLTTVAVGHEGPMVLPGWALDGVLAAFLGGWVWQAQRRSLPRRIYVHLLNAGALACVGAGEPA